MKRIIFIICFLLLSTTVIAKEYRLCTERNSGEVVSFVEYDPNDPLNSNELLNFDVFIIDIPERDYYKMQSKLMDHEVMEVKDGVPKLGRARLNKFDKKATKKYQRITEIEFKNSIRNTVTGTLAR